MNPRARRTLRGLAAATVATLVAAASHGLGGGGLPGVAGLTLALAFSAIVSIALVGRRMPLLRLAASITISQLAFHIVFSTLGGAGEVITTGGHHGALRVSTAGESVVHASPLMWLAHAAAAAITIAAIAHGERTVRALLRLGGMLLRSLLLADIRIGVPLDRSPRPATERSLVPVAARSMLDACGLRGPPPAAIAA